MDIAKFFAIYLVVLGHMYVVFNGLISTSIQRAIYSFHMPLFMMISGFFAHSAMQSDFKTLVTKKARQLLLPCVMCTILEIFFTFLTTGAMPLGIAREIVIGNSWFLKTLFCILIIVYVSLKATKRPVWACVLSCAIMLVIPHGYSMEVNYLLPFFWGGYFLKNHREGLEKYIKVISAVSLVIYVVCFNLLYKGFINISLASITSDYPNIIVNYITATSGCMVMFGITMAIDKCIKKGKLKDTICLIGQKTLEIYLLQTIILLTIIGNLVTLKFNIVAEGILAMIFAFVVIFFIIYISKQIDRNKYLRFAFFGKL